MMWNIRSGLAAHKRKEIADREKNIELIFMRVLYVFHGL